jgi:hypothetical protein
MEPLLRETLVVLVDLELIILNVLEYTARYLLSRWILQTRELSLRAERGDYKALKAIKDSLENCAGAK